MLSEISNIIIEDEFLIIVTSNGSKHTIAIDNDNPTHKSFAENIISMAISLVDETDEDVMDGLYSNTDSSDYWGNFADEDEDEWN